MDLVVMLKKILIKNGLLLSGFYILQNLLVLITVDPDNYQSGQILDFIMSPLSVLLTLYCCFAAHREFYRSHSDYISYQEAYKLGFIILLFSHLIYFIVGSVFYELLFKNMFHKQEGILGLLDLFSGRFSKPQLFATSIRGFSADMLWFDLKQALTSPGFIGLLILIYLESFYMIFSKAGKKPLSSLVPFYNMFVLIQIIGKPMWWFFMLFIPFINIYFYVLILHALSQKFGKTASFTTGLLFLPFIYYPKLGLSKATLTND